jgi:hypothetical protein
MTGPDVIALGVRLAGALESAHRAGVVHGDLRPDDMMLTDDGEPLLADFGLVTLVRPNASGVTDPKDLAHVAPELLDGEPVSPASDIYALASALYTLLSGQPAYVRSTDTSVMPVIKRIASDPLPDLTAKSVPPSVAEVVAKAMSKAPADRYKTAQDFGRALQQSQVALGVPMTDMTLLGAAGGAAAVAGAGGGATGATPKSTGWEGTHDLRAGAAGAAGAAVGAAAGAAAAGAGGGAAATSGGPGAPGGPGGPPGGPGGPGGPPGSATPSSRTPLFIGIGVAAVVIILAIAFFATRGGGSKNAVASETSSSTSRRSTSKSSSTTDTSDSTDQSDLSDSSDLTDGSSGTTDLINDGSQLAVSVPDTWSDSNTVTSTANNVPTIQASTSLTEFFGGTYLDPGIDSAVFSPTQLDPTNLDADVDAILNFSRTGGVLGTVCTRGTRADFVTTAGGLTARQELLTACNGGGDVLVFAATNATNSFVLGVEIHLGSPPDDAGQQLATDTVNVLKFP